MKNNKKTATKSAKQAIKTKAGRKLFDGKNTEIVLQKLEQVFSIGGTDEEACFYADISPSALYEYQKKHPEFLERKRALKQKPILKARQEVVRGLEGNPEFALKYLERKLPDEFRIRQKIQHEGEEFKQIIVMASGKVEDKLGKRLGEVADKT